jgi:diguanylate cyclase (GGDEF)-like protein
LLRKKRQDIIMVAALASFGLVMAYSAYLSGQFFRDRLLHNDALRIGEQWSNRIDKGALLLQEFKKDAERDGVLDLKVFNPNRNIIHSETSGRITQPDFKSLDFPASGKPQQQSLEAENADGLNYYAQVLTKLDDQSGYLQVTVDQSAAASMLKNTLSVFSIAIAVSVWLALFAPTIVVWGRMKERAAAEKRMHHMAHHDALTGLPNRILFGLRLEEAIERVKENKNRLALFCLDLDKFKEVNDTLGHLYGDMLLVQVAKRFDEIVRSKDMVARLGGDEFVIISEHIRTNEDAMHLAKRLVDHLAKPYVLEGNTVIVAASVGIAMAPDNGIDPVTLLKNADLALYRAKAESRGGFRFFETNMDAELQLRRDLESDLRDAVIRGGFAMHYQPQYDLNTEALVGYEALVRWPHPTKGFIPPSEFITLAEETGLIIPLGEWILRRACLDAQIWPDHVKIAVNLSPAQFMKNDVASMVKRIIFETGIDPRRLELEITENLLLQDTDNIIEQLTIMRNLGVTIAMDDFGTGYSSLSYLSRFPFDKIKIDQTFVQMLDTDPSVAAIVNSIVSLGKTLSMTVIAEGVENQAQADILRAAGCKHVQGYLFGRPGPTSSMDLPKSYSAMLREIVEESRAREVPEKKTGDTKVA